MCVMLFMPLHNACDSKYFDVALVAGNIQIVKPLQNCKLFMFSVHFTWMNTFKMYYVVSTYCNSTSMQHFCTAKIDSIMAIAKVLMFYVKLQSMLSLSTKHLFIIISLCLYFADRHNLKFNTQGF